MDDRLKKASEHYVLDYNEFLEIRDIIIDCYAKNCASVLNPKCVILGAQPGAGKTELGRVALEHLNNNAVFCNVDTFKNFHPKSSEIKNLYPDLYSEIVGPIAHQWNLALRSHCIENSFNFILETTFNSGKNINAIINNLKKHNFQVDLYVLSVPLSLSKLSATLRYEQCLQTEKSARFVSYESQIHRYNQIPETIKYVENNKIYDSISLYGRSILNINNYDDYGVYLIIKTVKSIYDDYLQERNKTIPENVKIVMKNMENEIIQLMAARNATDNEFAIFESEYPPEEQTNNKKL